MTKRRAIILLILILLFIIALLSVAAYTVQTQNDSNTTNALTSSMHNVLPVSTVPSQNPSVIPDSVPNVPNEAIDTDRASIQYKTVKGGKQGHIYTFEAPLDWNSLQKTVGTCTTVTIVSPQNTTIDITPSDCDTASQYGQLVQRDGYNISTNTADNATFSHILTTFHIAS